MPFVDWRRDFRIRAVKRCQRKQTRFSRLEAHWWRLITTTSKRPTAQRARRSMRYSARERLTSTRQFSLCAEFAGKVYGIGPDAIDVKALLCLVQPAMNSSASQP